MSERLPVTVVTGFLGAGKTTLVNCWLSHVERGDIAVIVNEFGDVGIDGELLAKRAQVLIEVAGGCVCCTTQTELVRALDAIATSQAPPKRILIETSGAASPASVVRAVLAGGRNERLSLDGVVTVFDSTRVAQVLEHELAREQLGYADVVVLSRSDECSQTSLVETRSTLARENGAAVFIETAHGNSIEGNSGSLDAVLASRYAAVIAPPIVRSDAHHAYESVALELEAELDADLFGDFVESELGRISGRIFRTKGIVAVAGMERRMILQGVADSIEVTFGEPWGNETRTSRLVIVGFGLDRTSLVRAFERCCSR